MFWPLSHKNRLLLVHFGLWLCFCALVCPCELFCMMHTMCWLYTCACVYVCHFDLAPIGSPAHERLLWSCLNQTTSPEIFCCCSEQITQKQGRKQRRERDKYCFQVILVALDHFTGMFCVNMIKLNCLYYIVYINILAVQNCSTES